MKWLARYLLPKVLAIAESRPPDFQVRRGEGNDEIYLRRWWWIPRNNYFNVYLHHMLKDDESDMHDHASWSLSLMLSGRIIERYHPDPRYKRFNSRGEEVLESQRGIIAGDLVYRGLHFAHQLLIREEAWTIFISGPKVREWGFWCPKGWRPWKRYVHVSQDPSGKVGNGGTSGVGVGCGEE